MSIPWGRIAALGGLFTVIAASPYLLRLLTLDFSLESAEIEVVYQAVYLFAGLVVAIVPLTVGGALLFVFFQIAGERA